MNKKIKNIIIWIVRIVPAVILLQTLFFKFTWAPESIEIFTKLWQEPIGRIWSGILELIAAALLLYPKYAKYWSILALFVMTWAIYFHITLLWYNDLFVLAVITFVFALINLIISHQSK